MNIYEEDVTDDYDRYNAMMNGRNVLDHYDYCWSCPECHEKLDVNMKELATYKQLYKIKKDLGINFECGYNHFPSLTKHEAWLLIKYLNKIEDKDKSVWDYMNNKFKSLDYQTLSAAAILMALAMVVIIGILFIVEDKFGKDVEG